MSLLDKIGLQELWGKIKNLVSGTTYTKAEIDSLISSLFRYKGTKSTVAEVEALTTKAVGDVWFVTADSAEYAWNGTKWEKLGPVIDLSAYLSSISIAGLTIDASNTTISIAQLRTALSVYTKTEVDTALSGKKSTQNAVSDPTASGTGVEFISGISQNAQGVISPSKKTVRTMSGASADAAGSTGLVPAPAQGDQGKFLNGAGQWSAITPAGIGAKSVQTPVSSPAVATGTSQDFISDVSQNANGEISVSKKHVKVLSGASASADGSAGLVPFPHKGWQNRYLRGDGTWQVPDDSEVASTIDGKTTVEEVLSHHSQQIDKLVPVIVTITVDASGASMSAADQAKLTADMIKIWQYGDMTKLKKPLEITPGNGTVSFNNATATSQTIFTVAFLRTSI